ncbi:YdcD family protein [Budvicia diplopodorum]|uniref:YdcD family protein n=1 Tax=Budvicia diplopodorum TaxID=1119056 RepID=UPI0013568598|nr:hypothetical protein [Budvicia diplopodorum]
MRIVTKGATLAAVCGCLVLFSALYYFYTQSHPSGIRLNFNGYSKLDDIQREVTKQNYPFIIERDQLVERGNGRFTEVKVAGYPTGCGILDLKLSFFNHELERISLRNVPEAKYNLSCQTADFEKYKSANGDTNVLKYNNDDGSYHLIFSDPIIQRKENEWIGKWS